MSKIYIVKQVNEDGSAVIVPANDSPLMAWVEPLTWKRKTVEMQEGYVITATLSGMAVPPIDYDDPLILDRSYVLFPER